MPGDSNYYLHSYVTSLAGSVYHDRCIGFLSQSTVVLCITKYGSTLYIGMDEVLQHHGHTFEKSNLNFWFQYEFSCVTTEW